MTVPALVQSVRAAVSPDFADDCTAHDIAHLDRVCGLSLRLGAQEGADPRVLAASAYVHDYHRVLEQRDGFQRPLDAFAPMEMICEVLYRTDLAVELVPEVCECVAFTDRYSFSGHHLAAPSLEAKLLRDADNLDAMGAIGIARAFMFGGALGEPIWAEGVEPSEEYAAGPTSSIVHHFHEKLMRLRDDMLSPAAKELALERHDFMLSYLDELMREWDFARLVLDAEVD